MNILKKVIHKWKIHKHSIMYILLVILSSLGFQVFTNQVLSRYRLFWASNYDDLLTSLFSAQITIIILPLSLFGIFTEITNEVYLGQSIAEYMYIYRSDHFFAFRYKELAVCSMILTLAEYILMSKELLAAELIVLVLNTTAMLASLFSWFEVRIKKEELHAFIQEQLYTTIEICTDQGIGYTYVIKLLSKLKDWVVNGGDHELVAAMEFYETLNIRKISWDMTITAQNTGEEKPAKGLSLSYKNTDSYFDEMVADLLRKQDYYRALRCSKSMLDTIAWYRNNDYYHPDHYYYRILLNLFRNMSEMEIDLLGDRWFCEYLVTILENGNINKSNAPATQAEKEKNSRKLQCLTEKSYTLVYEFLISIWQNAYLRPEYKQEQVECFLSRSIFNPFINYSALCVRMKLMESDEQKIIDMVVNRNWNVMDSFVRHSSSKEKEEYEFLEASMVLTLAYGYYLTTRMHHNFTIPQLTGYNTDIKKGIPEKYYIWEVLADCAWKYFDKTNEFLAANQNLNGDFYRKYYNIICETMLYSSMVNGQWPISIEKNIDAYEQVVHYFSRITGDDELLATAVSRYKKFIDLFGIQDKITDPLISDQLYELKKMILQYHMESLKKTAQGFDNNAFWEDLKRNVWKEIVTDQRFETSLSNVQVMRDSFIVEAEFIWLYLVLPYEGEHDANEIKKWLCESILRKSTSLKETESQKLNKPYTVLSLEWKDEPLKDKEINHYIKKEQSFKVRLDLNPSTNTDIFSMNFRTYEEAFEFVTSEYKKVVFRMKIII